MEKFLNQFLGTTDVPTYAAALILALIGAILQLRIKATKRNVLSTATPVKFSFWFMVQDNLQQLFTGFLITFVVLRFSNELLGQTLTMWLAFLIGMFNSSFAGIIQKFEIKARG
jgi:hypothetical protein